jgi:hypothetical protein
MNGRALPGFALQVDQHTASHPPYRLRRCEVSKAGVAALVLFFAYEPQGILVEGKGAAAAINKQVCGARSTNIAAFH